MGEPLLVMAGLVPAIRVFLSEELKTWMPAISAGMTPYYLAAAAASTALASSGVTHANSGN